MSLIPQDHPHQSTPHLNLNNPSRTQPKKDEMIIIGVGQWVDAVGTTHGDPIQLAERPKLRAEGKVPPINAKKIGTIAAREADVERIGLAAKQKKQKEKTPDPHPVNEDLVKHIFGNLMSVHQHHRAEAVKKGATITVPLPRLKEFLPQHQQCPMAPSSNPTSTSGTAATSTDKGKGKADDDEEK